MLVEVELLELVQATKLQFVIRRLLPIQTIFFAFWRTLQLLLLLSQLLARVIQSRILILLAFLQLTLQPAFAGLVPTGLPAAASLAFAAEGGAATQPYAALFEIFQFLFQLDVLVLLGSESASESGDLTMMPEVAFDFEFHPVLKYFIQSFFHSHPHPLRFLLVASFCQAFLLFRLQRTHFFLMFYSHHLWRIACHNFLFRGRVWLRVRSRSVSFGSAFTGLLQGFQRQRRDTERILSLGEPQGIGLFLLECLFMLQGDVEVRGGGGRGGVANEILLLDNFAELSQFFVVLGEITAELLFLRNRYLELLLQFCIFDLDEVILLLQELVPFFFLQVLLFESLALFFQLLDLPLALADCLLQRLMVVALLDRDALFVVEFRFGEVELLCVLIVPENGGLQVDPERFVLLFHCFEVGEVRFDSLGQYYFLLGLIIYLSAQGGDRLLKFGAYMFQQICHYCLTMVVEQIDLCLMVQHCFGCHLFRQALPRRCS